MNPEVELGALYWTLSGIFPGDGEISRFPFRERVAAAARSGFKGIGLWHTDLEHVNLHHPLKEMKMMLDDQGMKCIELEFLTDWFLDGARKSESDQRKRRLLEASAVLQANHVKVGDFYNCAVSMPRVEEAFAALCEEAAGYSATIGFEIMSCSMVNKIEDGIHLVKTVGAKNGGLILDILQVVNLGISYDQIRQITPQYLLGIELNDGTLPGSPRMDPSRARRFCGEGEYDIKGLISCVQEMGFHGSWAVEVMSKELAVLSLDELAARAYTTTMAEFEL